MLTCEHLPIIKRADVNLPWKGAVLVDAAVDGTVYEFLACSRECVYPMLTDALEAMSLPAMSEDVLPW